jgi:hypothetical protein
MHRKRSRLFNNKIMMNNKSLINKAKIMQLILTKQNWKLSGQFRFQKQKY